jgi:hypothetical protein
MADTQNNADQGAVYVISNPGMPGLIKIGRTRRDMEQRLSDLYNTSVPFRFVVIYACEVNRYQEVEEALHMICDSHRVNKDREFFNIKPEKVVPMLKLFEIKDVTKAMEQELNFDKAPDEDETPVSDSLQIPVGYKKYADLKDLLDPPEGFPYGYFMIRVAARHKTKKTRPYKLNGETYYSEELFAAQARKEGILKGGPKTEEDS